MIIEKREHRPKKNITPEQAEYLKANWGKVSYTVIQKHLKVSTSKLHEWKRELGLSNTKQNGRRKDKEPENEGYFFNWNSNYWPHNCTH